MAALPAYLLFNASRPVHRLALQIYMQQFDFRNLRIDEAFR
jgi:hypothetical protein